MYSDKKKIGGGGGGGGEGGEIGPPDPIGAMAMNTYSEGKGNCINVSISTKVRTRLSRDQRPTKPVNHLVAGSKYSSTTNTCILNKVYYLVYRCMCI